MKILDRLSSSLFSFKNLSSSVNDRKLLTFGYFLILLILLLIPNFIYSSTLLEIDYDSKLIIRNIFRNDENLTFKIENGKIINYGTVEYYYKDSGTGFGIYISDKQEVAEGLVTNSSVVILLLEDKAYISSGIITQELFTYSEVEGLEGLDFKDARDDKISFWDPVFKLTQDFLDTMKPSYTLVYYLITIVEGIITILVCALVLTLFNRFGNFTTLTFGDHFRLSIYSSTGYVLGNTLSTLFGFGLFYYIGLIISIACCIISGSKFTRRGGRSEL